MELFTQGKWGAQVLKSIQETVLKAGCLYLSLINWGEILYITEMRLGAQKKKFVKEQIHKMNIELCGMDAKRVELAASLKAQYGLPYTDAFAAALSIEKKASLVTGDADFKKISQRLKIIWIGG